MTPHRSRQGIESERSNQIINQVLNQMLGSEATKVFYHHLEATHSIQRDKIAQELDLFNNALREYLGSGALIIEHAIQKNLQSELEDSEINFADRFRVLKLA